MRCIRRQVEKERLVTRGGVLDERGGLIAQDVRRVVLRILAVRLQRAILIERIAGVVRARFVVTGARGKSSPIIPAWRNISGWRTAWVTVEILAHQRRAVTGVMEP